MVNLVLSTIILVSSPLCLMLSMIETKKYTDKKWRSGMNLDCSKATLRGYSNGILKRCSSSKILKITLMFTILNIPRLDREPLHSTLS